MKDISHLMPLIELLARIDVADYLSETAGKGADSSRSSSNPLPSFTADEREDPSLASGPGR